jgi:hypothetical protein
VKGKYQKEVRKMRNILEVFFNRILDKHKIDTLIFKKDIDCFDGLNDDDFKFIIANLKEDESEFGGAIPTTDITFYIKYKIHQIGNIELVLMADDGEELKENEIMDFFNANYRSHLLQWLKDEIEEIQFL